MSSTKAEYRSMALATSELLWLQSLLSVLKVPYLTSTVLCDNLSAIALAHNLVMHCRTKHMELNLFFVREKVLQKQLNVVRPRSSSVCWPDDQSLTSSTF